MNNNDISQEELESISRLLGESLDRYTVTRIFGNDLFIITSDALSWRCLAGREYIVDINKKTVELVRWN